MVRLPIPPLATAHSMLSVAAAVGEPDLERRGRQDGGEPPMTALHPERRDRAQRRATVLDPVCRMEISPEQAVASAKLDGRRRFYFCSLPCYEAFLDIPHAYVGWAGRHSRQVD